MKNRSTKLGKDTGQSKKPPRLNHDRNRASRPGFTRYVALADVVRGTPASVPATPQSRPSSPDCRDRSHPHWSTGCNPTKSHVRSIRAGSCRGCDTACPARWHKGRGRGRPLDWLHRLRHSPEEVLAAASHSRLASTLPILP